MEHDCVLASSSGARDIPSRHSPGSHAEILPAWEVENPMPQQTPDIQDLFAPIQGPVRPDPEFEAITELDQSWLA